MNTRISIVIPVFNEERYLGDCLDSVANQTLKPSEVIVIDNNSTDSTAKIALKYDFVKLITETQQGVGFARNAGFDSASGDLLVRIDADTRLDPDWSNLLLKEATRNASAAAFTGRGAFYDTPWPRLSGFVQVIIYQVLQWPAMRGATLWGATMAIRHDTWLAVRDDCHLRGDIDEDIDLSLQLSRRKYRIKFVPSLVSGMSLRRNQVDPLSLGSYLATWPRNYILNKRYLAAMYIAILTSFIWAVSALAWLLLQPFKNND